jgi:hypothetical protein
VLGSPVGLPFLSHPLPCTVGSLLVISFLSSLPASFLGTLTLVNGTHHGLATTVYVYMFDGKVLFPFAAMFSQSFHLRRERSRHRRSLPPSGLRLDFVTYL